MKENDAPQKNPLEQTKHEAPSPANIVRTFQSDAARSGETPEETPQSFEDVPIPVSSENKPVKEPEPVPITTSPVKEPEPPRTKEDALRIEDIKSRLATETSAVFSKEETAKERRATPPQSKTLSPLHTYTSDTAEAIREVGADSLTLIAKEEEGRVRDDAPPPQKLSSKSLMLLSGSIALLLVGAGVLGYFFFLRDSAPNVPLVTRIPTPIFINNEKLVEREGREPLRTRLVASITSTEEIPGTVTSIVVTEDVLTLTGTTTEPVPLGTIFSTLVEGVPSILSRAILRESMLGSYRGKDRGEFILVLEIESFERGFSGMLSWEATIAKDLAPLIGAETLVRAPLLPEPETNSEETGEEVATTTTEVTLPEPIFEDTVLQNHDARILKREDEVFLVYGFRNRTTLVITESVEAFLEIMARLATTHTTTGS